MTIQESRISLTCLVLLLPVAVLGCASQKGRQYSNTSNTREARSGGTSVKEPQKVIVTGSMIPQPVDKEGRPTEPTSSVQIIDQKTINVVGGGSVQQTLSKLPYTSRGNR